MRKKRHTKLVCHVITCCNETIHVFKELKLKTNCNSGNFLQNENDCVFQEIKVLKERIKERKKESANKINKNSKL